MVGTRMIQSDTLPHDQEHPWLRYAQSIICVQHNQDTNLITFTNTGGSL